MRTRLLALAFAIASVTVPTGAQWLDYPANPDARARTNKTESISLRLLHRDYVRGEHNMPSAVDPPVGGSSVFIGPDL